VNPQEEIVFVVDDARVRELLPLVGSGLRNKHAAAELGISELTLQIHRRSVMQKMAAASLADLVRIAENSRRGNSQVCPKSVVAIVDDNRRLLESLEDLLESAGHTVRAFSSAQALLDSDAVLEIDCLVTDIAMPGVDGFELQRLLSEQRPELPVILITGRREIAEPPRTKHNRFFRKPFDGQALLAAIGDALNGEEH